VCQTFSRDELHNAGSGLLRSARGQSKYMYVHLNLLDSSGVGHVVCDAAGVLTVGKADESLLAPRWAPAVSHLPVAGTSVNTNKLHGVVDVVAAGGHDTTGVGGPGGGIDGDGEGTSGFDVRGHGGLARLDGLVTTHSQDELVRVRAAGLGRSIGTRGVGVVRLLLDTTGSLDVVVGSLLETTVASEGGLVALHQLLLGEKVGGGELSHRIGLDLLRGGKSPARSAVSLVLDGGSVDTSPVLSIGGSGVGGDGGNLGVHLLGGVGGVGEVSLGELGLGKISESGDTVLGRATSLLLGGVSGVDNSQVLDEVGISVGLLNHGGVLLVVGLLELLEHELQALGRSSGKASRSSGSESRKGDNLVDHFEFCLRCEIQ
jgi:hypothetical protein